MDEDGEWTYRACARMLRLSISARYGFEEAGYVFANVAVAYAPVHLDYYARYDWGFDFIMRRMRDTIVGQVDTDEKTG